MAEPHGLGLEEFYRLHKPGGKDAFLKKYALPFIVEINPESEAHGQCNPQYGTLVGYRATSGSVYFEAKQIRSDSRVFPLVKRVQVFPDKITIGRSGNNDIVLDDLLVSKLQSYVTFEQGKTMITDVESKNGTFIDSRKIPPMQKFECLDGALLGFGPKIKFLVMSAELLWDNMMLAMEH